MLLKCTFFSKAIQIKSAMTVYMESTEAILNDVQSYKKKPPAAKEILKKKGKAEHITLLTSKYSTKL